MEKAPFSLPWRAVASFIPIKEWDVDCFDALLYYLSLR